MGILSRLVAKDYSVEDWVRDTALFFRGAPTSSGVAVNEHSALRFVDVYSCVRVLAEAMGSLPLVVYRARKTGSGADKAWDHPLFGLLHDEPNDEMTQQTWIETQMGHLVLSGNSYSIKTLNGRGQVIDLYPVPWDKIEPRRDKDTGKIVYAMNDRGSIETLPAEMVMHTPGLGYDGTRGYSNITMAREAVAVGIAAQEFIGRFFSQGLNAGSVVKHPGQLKGAAYDNLKKSFDERGTGLNNAWRPLILEEGMQWERTPMLLVDAQFIENRKLNRDQICGLMRVKPHMIANLEHATFSNIEHMSLEFVMYTLLPYARRYEQSMNRRLFTRQERDQGYYVKFNLAGLLRGDAKSRAEALNVMRQNGVINADEWRELEEMNPEEGGTGKVYLVNGNMIPIELAGKVKVQQQPAAPEKEVSQ